MTRSITKEEAHFMPQTAPKNESLLFGDSRQRIGPGRSLRKKTIYLGKWKAKEARAKRDKIAGE